MDVANFEEAWEWMQDVLIPGVFDSDVDDSGNIMMCDAEPAPAPAPAPAPPPSPSPSPSP